MERELDSPAGDIATTEWTELNFGLACNPIGTAPLHDLGGLPLLFLCVYFVLEHDRTKNNIILEPNLRA